MHEISEKLCSNHAAREAVAQCPHCSRFFCRECVTEHADKVVCSQCLAQLASSIKTKKKHFRSVMLVMQFAAAFLMASYFFYICGRLLLLIPDAFHDGTLWDSGFWL